MTWLRNGAATAAGGMAHVGTNEPAREDALARLPKWLDAVSFGAAGQVHARLKRFRC
jgi:hypothetical protein